MKKIILAAALIANVSQAKTLIDNNLLNVSMNNFDEIVTNNKSNYMSLKFSLLATLVNKLDYSEMDLESPYSYSAQEETFSQNILTKEYDCAVSYDFKEITMRKKGKILKIRKGTNFIPNTFNPAGCDNDSVAKEYSDYLEVTTYLAPSRSEFKENLVKELSNFKPKNPSKTLDSERVFKLERDGFAVWNKNERTFSAHAIQVINADILFEEDNSEGHYRLGEISGIDLNEKITETTEVRNVYIGNYSYITRGNPFVEQSTTYYESALKAPTISEFLSNL